MLATHHDGDDDRPPASRADAATVGSPNGDARWPARRGARRAPATPADGGGRRRG